MATRPLASVKLDVDLTAWLRLESVQRGVSMSELAEDLIQGGLDGKAPWKDPEFRAHVVRVKTTRMKRNRHRY